MKIIVFIGFIDAITVPAVSDTIYYSIFFSCQIPKYRFRLALKLEPEFTQRDVVFRFWVPNQIHFKAKPSLANPH